jgi:DNA (cytosine-5)-methyltransferase 1
MKCQEAGIRPRSGAHGLGLRIGSLFSGIGGLELGLEWAGVGRTVYQVELDPYCQGELARNWPDVPRWTDIEGVDPAKLPAADVVCGGFPCVDLSVAGVGGARLGLQGTRSGLWSRMAGVVETQRPTWVVVENVARGVDKWLPVVRADLERLGYTTLPVPLEARHVGAPHHRPRVFVLAHSDRFALRVEQQRVSRRREGDLPAEGEPLALEHGEGRGWQTQPPLSVVADGLSRGVAGAYYRAVGNAVVPQVAEVIGWMIRELVDAGAAARRAT